MNSSIKLATLGGGCFWCIEAAMQRLYGVTNVLSGYSGGKKSNPNYREVCSGYSGYAEVIQFQYDETLISYADIINVFLHIHDPTTLNQQMYDKGTQYRSIIQYHSEDQHQTIKEVIDKVNKSQYYKNPIVTEVSPFEKFYKAESEHQNFYNDNPYNGYCKAIIDPKIKKLFQLFKDKTYEGKTDQGKITSQPKESAKKSNCCY